MMISISFVICLYRALMIQRIDSQVFLLGLIISLLAAISDAFIFYFIFS